MASTFTCGFNSVGKPRLAYGGDNCRVDSARGLWGFCYTTVFHASDCGLAGYCIDSFACSDGCGPYPNNPAITTFTCSQKSACSILISENIDSQTFDYIACAGKPGTVETLYATPPQITMIPPTSTPSSTPIPGPSVAPTASSTSKPKSTSQSSSSIGVTKTASTSPVGQPILSNSSASITNHAASSAGKPMLSDSTTSTSHAASSAYSQNDSAVPLGPIIGGVLGGLAIIGLTILGILLMRRRKPDSAAGKSRFDSSESDNVAAQDQRRYMEEPKYYSEMDGEYGFEMPAGTASYWLAEADASRKPVELPAHSF